MVKVGRKEQAGDELRVGDELIQVPSRRLVVTSPGFATESAI